MTDEDTTELAHKASAIGMRAYRDGENRLWISLPDDRLPGELRSIALALLKLGQRAPGSETHSGALLLRVLSWADGAGVSVRQILETVRDATGPDDGAIAELEELVANLRPRPAGTIDAAHSSQPPAAAPAAPAVPVVQGKALVSMTVAPALAPVEKEDIYPTPIWITRLLQQPMELEPAETRTVQTEAPAGSLDRSSSSTRVEFRNLIERISGAIAAARASAPGKAVPELESAEQILRKVEDYGPDAYQQAHPLLAEQIVMMGPEILSRIDEVTRAYRQPRWLRMLQG